MFYLNLIDMLFAINLENLKFDINLCTYTV